jgi:hypothetical protein
MAKRNLSSILSVAAVAVVAISAGGRAACSKPGGAATAAASVAPAAAAAPASADDLLSNKLSFYIDCVNLVDPIVVDSKRRYMRTLTEDRQIDPKNPPDASALGGRLDTCFEKLAEGKKTAPAVADVEAAAVAYEASLRALEPILVEGERYYRQSDYKDDHFAKGLALHPKIMAGYEAFFAARGTLHDAIDKYNKEILARSVELIEKKEGKSLHYYSRKVMNEGGELIDLALDPATDPARLRDAILAYATLFNEMVTLADARPADKNKVRNWGSFQNDGETLVTALKELGRDIGGQLEKDKTRPVEISRDVRANVLKRYNDMVEKSNQLEFEP